MTSTPTAPLPTGPADSSGPVTTDAADLEGRSEFSVPSHIRPLREAVLRFMTEHVEPVEADLDAGTPAARELLRTLQAEAAAQGLWALGHPAEIGGGGLPFLD